MSIGQQLHERRQERGWSLSDLSARSGVSETHIHQVERGERGIGPALLRKLADALDLDPYALNPALDRDEERNAVRRAEAPTARTHGRLIECIAAHIETELQARGWRWQDLRRAAHVSNDAMVHLRNRMRLPSRAVIERIADALGVSVTALTEGEWVQEDRRFQPVGALRDAILAYDPAARVAVEREDPSPWKTSDYWLAVLLSDGSLLFVRGKQDWADWLVQRGDLTRLRDALDALSAVPDPPAHRRRPAGVYAPSARSF